MGEDDAGTCRTYHKFVIVLAGFLLSVSFGTMLGWPSPTYPNLLSPNATIPITLDQSAMITGMLLIGKVLATPFAGLTFIDRKTCIHLALVAMAASWTVLYIATNVLSLCLSRLLFGISAAIAIGNFRFYAQETLTPELNSTVHKKLNLFTCLGIVTSFVIGPMVSFRLFAIFGACVPVTSFVVFLFAPKSPRYFLERNELTNAKNVVRSVNGKLFVQEGMENLKKTMEKINRNVFQILRSKATRNDMFLLTILIIIQQFSGGPALIVYSQIIFSEFGYSKSHICAIVYATLQLSTTYLGLRYVHKFRRKPVLLVSLLGSTASSMCHVVFLYFQPEGEYLTVLPFISMCLFICFNTFGVTMVPGLYVNDLFDDNCKYTVNCYLRMFTFALAVIVTKIFQVLYGVYGMYVSFSLFSVVGVVGLLIILFCFNETKDINLTNQ